MGCSNAIPKTFMEVSQSHYIVLSVNKTLRGFHAMVTKVTFILFYLHGLRNSNLIHCSINIVTFCQKYLYICCDNISR